MLAEALLTRCGAELRTLYRQDVRALERAGSGWIARGASGQALAEAPVVVLANAADATRLAPSDHIRLRRVRGQVTLLPGARFTALRAVLLRGGFLVPPLDGVAVAGASYDFDDDDPRPRADSHAGNLERLEGILPGASAGLDPAVLAGRVSWRAVAADRLPLIGALASEQQSPAAGPALGARLVRTPGLYAAFGYASRGLLWAGLGAELLASLLEGDPLPVEAALADAVDPGRFLLRAIRRAGSPGARRARP
jgi:tRNA 5-methylaminomethyl-2-thiouridine biosynthesis bifunctional protein